MRKLRFLTIAFMVAAVSIVSTGYGQDAATRPDRSQNDQVERHEVRRVPTDSFRHGQGPTVKEALVKKLIKANEAEIELARMAHEKTDNQELKQLTQTIIQDHQALNQELQQQAGQLAGNSQTYERETEVNRDRRETRNRESTGRNSIREGRRERETARREDRDRSRETGRRETDRGETLATRRTDRSDASQSQTVPPELCAIAEQACDNALRMTKEMLSNYSGQDFSMAFLGQQCVAHTMMLAELKAIQSTGPQELQSVAEKAAQKVEQHLKTAKQLAKKLEDDRKNARS